VASTIGGSAGKPQKNAFSGRIDDEEGLADAAKRLVGPVDLGSAFFILERYLHGPELFAETVVQHGELVRVTYRALKVPINSGANPQRGEASLWQWPAVLTRAQYARCTDAVQETVGALDLRSGVFGIQLVLDDAVPGGCAFLEINLRPHAWPLLHDEAMQLYFGDVWLYSEMAIRIALNQSRAELEARMTDAVLPPPYQMTAICHGAGKATQLFYVEWIMWRHAQGLCNVTIQPFSGAWAT